MRISFEKLVSRSLVRFLSRELDLAGVKTTVNNLIGIAVIGGIATFIAVAVIVFALIKLNAGIAVLAGIFSAAILEFAIYSILELKIEQRKNFVEGILPEYLQLTSANIRSGMAIDKAMVSATRPEFKYFSDDVVQISKQLYTGETFQNSLISLGNNYRSVQLRHTVRMINESMRYGGGMTDMLNDIAKDIRNQQTIQKEISGQLFMYTIFISFAAIIGAPALYALTDKMIAITDNVWAGILQQNPGGLPSTGVSFLKPSPPKVTQGEYNDFAILAILIISALGSFIVSVIMNGSIIRGIRYLPIFLLIGFTVFFITGFVISSIFNGIAPGT
ncbi:MAG: type II secretion system F family protein [Candidatus Marsarchaeota archaeon]|jgi:hypothetical protein|nr:type II secretion system F family protein [Candidatus Marsarchaeota archaeon]